MSDAESTDSNSEDAPVDTISDGDDEVQSTIVSQVEVTDEGPCRKRLKIEISLEKVEEELDTTYRQLRDTVQVPGFRKGKAPLALMKKRYRTGVQADVEEELKARAVEEQFEAAEWKPLLGSVAFENDEFVADTPFTFEVVFDVQPTFDLPEYKGIKI